MFVDKAKIYVKAGDGGNGIVSFRREKYVPAGGPDGGDGGKGGDIVFVASDRVRTLMDFRYKKKYQANNGDNGGRKNKFGKMSPDIVVEVPVGTLIFESKSKKLIADLNVKEQRVIVARGGKGGKGNQHFATPTRQAPTFAQMGRKGDELEIILELKLLADVGLVGYPNVGKSTLLSVTTKANPKIANYHFTTLSPNLGVVEQIKGKSFVMADIPGLIEGASDGIGLGHEFLRHVERTRLVIHVLDFAGSEGRDAFEDFCKINAELSSYSKSLAGKRQIIAANKIDLIYSDEELEQKLSEFKEKILEYRKNSSQREGLSEEMAAEIYEIFPISSATGAGLSDLMNRVTTLLEKIEPEELFSTEDVYIHERKVNEISYSQEAGVFCVEGDYIDRLMYSTNIDDIESVRSFQNALKNKGVIDHLKGMGCSDGDTVRVGGYEFEFYS